MIRTIEDLYAWAKEKGIEKYDLYVNDECFTRTIYIGDINIDTESEEIHL